MGVGGRAIISAYTDKNLNKTVAVKITQRAWRWRGQGRVREQGGLGITRGILVQVNVWMAVAPLRAQVGSVER